MNTLGVGGGGSHVRNESWLQWRLNGTTQVHFPQFNHKMSTSVATQGLLHASDSFFLAHNIGKLGAKVLTYTGRLKGSTT